VCFGGKIGLNETCVGGFPAASLIQKEENERRTTWLWALGLGLSNQVNVVFIYRKIVLF
jgi:hypothetical protein